MALPTKADLVTLDWSKGGLPWLRVPARSDIDPGTLDWSKDGLPWVVNPLGGTLSQSLYPVGITTAEALGLPTIVPGPITLYIQGIPSNEAWGLPQVSLGSATLSPPGIPSAEVFGLPIIVPGPITLYPVSIPSAEAFGIPALTFMGDTVIPEKLFLSIDYRHLRVAAGLRRLAAAPQTTRLQVTPDA